MNAQSETGWSTSLASDTKARITRYLARALLAGEPREDALVARAAQMLGREWRWLRPLAVRFAARFAGQTRPRLREVIAFLDDDRRFQRHCERNRNQLTVVQRIAGPAPMLPVLAAMGWGVPAIATVEALAEWARLSVTELQWFADLKGLGRKSPDRLRHYQSRLVEKRSGGFRLIEAPKQRMMSLQRQVLDEILDRVPVHEAVHGFVRGRGIRTFAAPHVGQAAVLRMDLKDFFPSIRRTRVQSLFRTLGYPEPVADLLGGIVTTRTPRDVFRAVGHNGLEQVRQLYQQSHLPQGAPTSPALANLCGYRLDCRLTALARASGAVYTRYADDLAFSGGADFLRGSRRFAAHVGAAVMEQGLAVNFRKTRVMRQGVRQHLAGLVVNERVNVKRAEFDRLKAILTNCLRNGPEAENRDGRPDFRAHLLGRVSFVASVHAERGQRLQELFSRVNWSEGG